jgi:anti-sigma B factor antagonist
MDEYCVECSLSVALVRIQGETSPTLIAELKKVMEPHLTDPAISRLIVDLSNVSFIDTTGINFLVTMANRGAEAGKQLFLKQPSDRVMKVLRLVQLETHFLYLDTNA